MPKASLPASPVASEIPPVALVLVSFDISALVALVVGGGGASIDGVVVVVVVVVVAGVCWVV